VQEREVQALLLVRAVEEVDAEGRVWPEHEREAATRRALAESGLPEGNATAATLSLRARLLLADLERRFPAVGRALAWARGGAGLSLAICVAALAIGVATNLLGPRRQINLLAFPLLALIGWNLAVYLLSAFSPLLRTRVGGLSAPLLWLPPGLRQGGRGRRGKPRSAGAVVARALPRFVGWWRDAAAPLLAARARRTLHLAALCMVGGAMGGMYLRGIAFEYRATWESTLLDRSAVQGLLTMVLGPAASLLGVAIPDVGPLRAPGSGDAAIWIHLYATTTLIVVVLPRALLALAAGWRARRLAADVPVDLQQEYYLKLAAAWRGEATRVAVIPYSYRPEPHESEALKRLLYTRFGGRSHIEAGPTLEYGVEAGAAIGAAGGAGDSGGESSDVHRVVLFNLAQTPELEVHGGFLRELKQRADERGEQLAVIVDVSRYRATVSDPRRIEERIEAWRQAVSGAGLDLDAVDLGRPAGR
jgi:hypothetical protein